MNDRTVPIDPTLADAPLVFTYRNWRGEVSTRRVQPMGIRFGSTEWHPEAQWLLRALDIDKGEEREFAMKDIAASPAAPGAEVEPVAYRYHHARYDGWFYNARRPDDFGAYAIQPLYTAEALSAARAQARREALEEAARWHEAKAETARADAERFRGGSNPYTQRMMIVAQHKEAARAIRTLHEKGARDAG